MMKTNPYYTHRKVLTDELGKLDYSHPVHCLEFGVGHGSSLIFQRFLMEHEGLIVDSYESDERWFADMSAKYLTLNYHFNYVDSWDNLFLENGFNEFYDLVFVDQSPWEARIQTIESLRDNTGLFILHDYCYYNKGVVEDIYSVSEGSFFHTKFGSDFILEAYCEKYPPTLVLRNKK